MERWKIASEYDRAMNTRGLIEQIPFLTFKPSWVVKIIPPFAGASVRFCVAHKDRPEKDVSVYLDCFNNLGYMDQPYWELYPAADGDTARFYLNETDELLKAIDKSLKKYNRKHGEKNA